MAEMSRSRSQESSRAADSSKPSSASSRPIDVEGRTVVTTALAVRPRNVTPRAVALAPRAAGGECVVCGKQSHVRVKLWRVWGYVCERDARKALRLAHAFALAANLLGG